MIEIRNCSGKNVTAHVLIILNLWLGIIGSSAWCGEQNDSDEKLKHGQGLFDAGEILQAMELFEEMVAFQPDHKNARGMLFKCYRFVGIEYYGQSRYQRAIDV
jgi:Tfp pilus assembly protein PilF